MVEDYNEIDLNKFMDYYDSHKTGIYALFLKEPKGLHFFGIKNLEIMKLIQTKMIKCDSMHHIGPLLYIGKTERSIKSRIREHFSLTPKSTLRRTIASLMGFQSIKTLCNNKLSYDVDEQSNLIITNWLKKYSYFKIYETNMAKKMEEEYIAKYQPPLNIEDCDNGQLTTLLSNCRKVFKNNIKK